MTENSAHKESPVNNLSPTTSLYPYGVRRIGRINWRGVTTLYVKEVQRFIKVILQTVLAPAVTTMLFMTIFIVAIGGRGRIAGDIPFERFLVPGLIMMTILQNSFANTSSSLLIAKINGNIVDVLMTPLSPGELTSAYILGGITRGAICAVAVFIPASFVAEVSISHVWAILYFGVAGAMMLSTLGAMTGIWADKVDHAAAVTNFFVMPLSFLSGTFYSIQRLPQAFQDASQFNPFFYFIDGFRYGFIGRADGNIAVGVAVVLVANAILWCLCYWMFKSGYKLKT